MSPRVSSRASSLRQPWRRSREVRVGVVGAVDDDSFRTQEREWCRARWCGLRWSVGGTLERVPAGHTSESGVALTRIATSGAWGGTQERGLCSCRGALSCTMRAISGARLFAGDWRVSPRLRFLPAGCVARITSPSVRLSLRGDWSDTAPARGTRVGHHPWRLRCLGEGLRHGAE